ncbi:MAG TPA: ABC transporter permease [Vicinamibacterales bacterium]|nr:ABC transporter permease [Vicinamibacterales bacterium]
MSWLMASGVRDLRYALRRWRRRPAFVATAVGTLALGIGAATALFSVVDAVLLRPPAWPAPDRLAVVHAVFPDRRNDPAAAASWIRGPVTYNVWDALRADATFAEVAVWRPVRSPAGSGTTFGDDRTEIVATMDVSSNFLPLVGAGVVHGRLFTDAEDRRPADSVLITHEAWQRRFGGRADVIGLGVPLGSASTGGRSPKTIVGVLAPGFEFGGSTPEFLFPVGISAETGRTYGNGSLRVLAAVAPGASLDAATSAASAILARVDAREPTSAQVLLLTDELYGPARRPLVLLFAAAGVLLLVACTNVAGLLLGEARVRRHEYAVRAALGGGQRRVLQQLVVEHSVLAAAGSAAGLLLAYVLVQVFVGTAPAGLPRVDEVHVDRRAALFALGAGLTTLFVFGLTPASALARTPAIAVITEGSRDFARRRPIGHRLIVAFEMALALVLVVGASLLGETLYRVTSQPLGFNPSGLAVVSFQMTTVPGPQERIGPRGSQTPEEVTRIRRQIEENMSLGWWLHLDAAFSRIDALPGVTRVAGAGSAPFLGAARTVNVRLPGRPETDQIGVRFQSVSDRYFETLEIPIARGRRFVNSDRRVHRFMTERGKPLPTTPAIVSESLARRMFDGDAVGRQLISGSGAGVAPYDILGVVPDVRSQKDGAAELPVVYAFAQGYRSLGTLLVRTGGDAEALLPAIRDEIRRFDSTIVVTSTTTMAGLLAATVEQERFRATVASVFGSAALGLAAVGLYGLAARRAAERRREIAVRVALGADRGDVRSLVHRETVITVLLGLAAGLPCAFGASLATQAFLFGVSPTQPRVFIAAAITLAAVAYIAPVLPARRAAAIDPMVVLRE